MRHEKVLREAESSKKKAEHSSKLSLDKVLLTPSCWREYRTQKEQRAATKD